MVHFHIYVSFGQFHKSFIELFIVKLLLIQASQNNFNFFLENMGSPEIPTKNNPDTPLSKKKVTQTSIRGT